MSGTSATIETGAAPLRELEPAIRDTPLPGTRWWFALFVAWMAGWAALALSLFDESASTPTLALQGWILALMCFYLALCNAFAPLPTAWIVLLAASDQYAIVETAWLRVIVVTVLASASTVVANLNEYHALAYLLRFGLGRRVRETRVYGWAARWFDRSPFQMLLLIAFVPIPVDAVRWLAILRRYSRLRFALAYFIGRGGRYAIFAAFSVLAQLAWWQILLIQAGLVAASLFGRLAWSLMRRRTATDPY